MSSLTDRAASVRNSGPWIAAGRPSPVETTQRKYGAWSSRSAPSLAPRSSGSASHSRSTRSCPSRPRWTNSPPTSDWRSTRTSSLARIIVLIGTATAPMRAIAASVTAKSGPLPWMKPTRAPLPMPRAISPRASSAERRSSAAKLIVSSAPPPSLLSSPRRTTATSSP